VPILSYLTPTNRACRWHCAIPELVLHSRSSIAIPRATGLWRHCRGRLACRERRLRLALSSSLASRRCVTSCDAGSIRRQSSFAMAARLFNRWPSALGTIPNWVSVARSSVWSGLRPRNIGEHPTRYDRGIMCGDGAGMRERRTAKGVNSPYLLATRMLELLQSRPVRPIMKPVYSRGAGGAAVERVFGDP